MNVFPVCFILSRHFTISFSIREFVFFFFCFLAVHVTPKHCSMQVMNNAEHLFVSGDNLPTMKRTDVGAATDELCYVLPLVA